MKVTLPCVRCGKRFELSGETVGLIGSPNQPKYCGKKCRRANSRQRYEQHAVCACCGGPKIIAASTYGTGACGRCMSVAYLTCFSKSLRWLERPEPMVHEDGRTLSPYECLVCEGWHLTSQSGPPPSEWNDACRRVGAFMRENGVKWERAAAWKKKGTSEL